MSIRIHAYLFVALTYMFYIGKIELFLLFYLSIFIHEIAHIVVALILNTDVIELYLMPFGVNAKYEAHISGVKEVLISLAGPFMSFILAYFSKYILLRDINYLILFLNLIPIYPLDGGRIQKSLFIKKIGYKKGIKLSFYLSDFWLIIMLIFSILLIWKYSNYYLLFLSMYLFILSKVEMKKERIFEAINYLQIEQECIK